MIVAELTDPATVEELNFMISNELQETYSDTYMYSNEFSVGTIFYTTKVLYANLANGVLQVQRVLSIPGFDNECEVNMQEPNTTQGGKSASQISAISLAQLSTSYDYALENGFFNKQLGPAYNSDTFQFNAGSL